MAEQIDGLDLLKVSIDDIYGDGTEDLGWDLTAYTATPAILQRGVAFSGQEAPKQLNFTDDVKMRIAAPAMIPMNIYRNDSWGEYYVQFSVEEIEKIFQKFMKNLKNQEKFNLEHTDEKVPAYILEAVLIDSENKVEYIKSEYGIDLPVGSVFLVTQVTDRDYYDKLVANDQLGYSIEGFLGFAMSEVLNNKNKNSKMAEEIMLPNGEHTIGDKIYVVKDGKVIEVKDVTAPEAPVELEDVATEEPKAEELEESVPSEEPKAEVLEEALPETPTKEEVAMAIDETELMTILQPKFDEILNLIAELKSMIDSKEDIEPEEIEKVEMSIHERFASAMAFKAEN